MATRYKKRPLENAKEVAANLRKARRRKGKPRPLVDLEVGDLVRVDEGQPDDLWLVRGIEPDALEVYRYRDYLTGCYGSTQFSVVGVSTFMVVLLAAERVEPIFLDKLYGAKAKFDDGFGLDDIRFYFHAIDQAEADQKMNGWNQYHSLPNAPGYGHRVAVEVAPEEVRHESMIHNEWTAR